MNSTPGGDPMTKQQLVDEYAREHLCAMCEWKKGAKMRERPLNLDEYGISKERYLELKHFCKRYAEMRLEIASARGLDAVSNDGLPHGNGKADPTARKADRALKLSTDVRIIEDAAREADPLNWCALLKNVTEGTAYEYQPVYCGRRQFYESRRKFFWLLDKKKG